MTHRLATNYAKNYCNRTLIVKVIVESVVTCFLGHGVVTETAGTARKNLTQVHHIFLSLHQNNSPENHVARFVSQFL